MPAAGLGLSGDGIPFSWSIIFGVVNFRRPGRVFELLMNKTKVISAAVIALLGFAVGVLTAFGFKWKKDKAVKEA